MLRAARMKRDPDIVDGFRMRGGEVTRLESFSDAVFGFALTLLVVSLEVPKSFSDLMATMRGAPAFAVCFAMLAAIWNTHYKYCRRYGLDDYMARLLTCVLLFIVLLYVYPLKFLFTLGINDLLFGRSVTAVVSTKHEASILLAIYSYGFASVYLAFELLYLHALRLGDQLGLSDLEKSETRYLIFRLLVPIGFGLIIGLLSQFLQINPIGGYLYFLIFPILRVMNFVHDRRRVRSVGSARDP